MRKTLQKSAALLMLSLFGTAAGWAQSTLYSIDFTSSEPTGWTTVDKSSTPNVSWVYGRGGFDTSANQVQCARLASDTSSEQDDYYVSPGVRLEAGKTYAVSLSNQKQNSPTSLSIEVGQSQTDMSQNKVLRANIPFGDLYYGSYYEYYGTKFTSVSESTFTPSESGTYYFSMHGKAPQETDDVYSRIFVYDFSVKEVASTAYPYSVNFIESTDGWKAIDANESGRTISASTGLAYNVDGYSSAQTFPYMQDEVSWKDCADEYWVSPAMTFEAGKTYKAAFDVLQLYGSNSFSGKVALTLGQYGDDASTFQKVADLTLVADDPVWPNTVGSTDPHTFQVAESGRYFVAAHVTSPTGSNYVYIGFKGFNIDETSEASETTIDFSAQTPDQPDQPDPGQPDPDQPGDDVATKALPYYVNFSVEGNGDEWTVVDKSSTPGSTWAYGSKYTASGYVYGYKIDDDDYNSDDYFVSPAFKLEAGKKYTIDLTNYAYTYGGDLFIEYGTNKDDVTTFTQLAQTPRATENGQKIQGQYELSVPADGVYYIALRAKANMNLESPYYTYLLVNSFGISAPETGGEEKPDVLGTLPYSVTFDSAEKFDEWSTIDNSDVKGVTWEYSSSDFAGKPAAGYYTADPNGSATDWLVSPRFELKEGKSYNIKLVGASGEDNGVELSLDYFQGTKDTDNFKSLGYIGNTLPATDDNGNPKDTWTLDVAEDGDYWFAIRANGPYAWASKTGTNVSIYSVEITENADEEEDIPVALPYSVEFTTKESAAGWYAMARSKNQSSKWGWNEYGYQEYDENWETVGTNHSCVAFNGEWDSSVNDYWVSPAFNLVAGNTYKIKTHTTTNRSCYNEGTTAFTLKLGTNKKVQGTFNQTIGTIALNTVYDRAADEFEFTPTESGKYYVAYNINDAVGKNAYGYIFDFSMEEIVEPVAELPYAITFDSADKFNEWSTIDNSDTPGVTWEYTASDFAGKAGAFMGADTNSRTYDWLISPKFNLKGGKTYVVKVDAKSGENNQLNLCLDYFMGAKNRDYANEVTMIGSQLPVEKDGELTDSWTVDITEDGAYWFALRAVSYYESEGNDAISIYSVNISEEKDDPVALPYSTDFSTEAGTKGWKALDASTTKDITWNWNGYGYLEFDSNWNTVGSQHPCVSYGPEWMTGNTANDYYTSPAFTLEAGKTYVVSARTAVSQGCLQSENVESTKLYVKLGKERMVESSYDTTVGDIPLSSVYDRPADTFEFTVPETGVYHLAYNVNNPVDAYHVYAYLFGFSLAEKEVVAAAPVSALDATELADTKEVKLTWTNPMKDAKGNDLAADASLTVKVYEGETLLTTFDDQTPGQEASYTYAPATYEGVHSYKVVVVYNGVESEAATKELTIVVDGINGVIAVPAGAKVTVHTMGGALVGSDLKNLSKGTYIVTVKTVDGTVKTVKVNK